MFAKTFAATAALLCGFAISNAAVAAQKPYQATASVACTTFACPLNFPLLKAPVVLELCPFNEGELYFLNATSYLFGDSGGYFFVTVETQLTLQPLVCTISGDYID